ncbi:mechanosensitive ion channel [candidate division KSB1 bacterium]|nr:mechanosensitive ion channel [candidate division KSB1 bacterium]
MDNLNSYSEEAVKMLMSYGPKLILAILTLFIGLWVIKLIVRFVSQAMEKSETDVSLRSFLSSLISIFLKILLFITVISMIGVQMTSFVAILGAAGLAVGLALQGSLANFAGGVLILFFKPFKVGDYIDAQGFSGTVREIQILHTILKTPDNKTITMPNGSLSNSTVTNFTTEETRRVDFVFGIGYSDDIAKAKDIIHNLIDADERILKDPEPAVVISELGDSSVNITTRVWTKTSDYWAVRFDLIEKVKLQFDANGISIPFPQRDIHVYNHSK